MKRLADSIENFEALAKQIQPSVEALSQTERYAKQLAQTTDQLQSLQQIYASQVESNSKRADAERDIAEQSAMLKAQLIPLIENIRNLNEVYSSMLNAMKK